ncbi:MAG: peptidoglycan-associated lipoprotein Pal [Candidatus Sumerlaeota bacterium]|nr:peptidoglycan-associated lipoprotein Pal [Candidatus Sumerlaeota bacterium]
MKARGTISGAARGRLRQGGLGLVAGALAVVVGGCATWPSGLGGEKGRSDAGQSALVSPELERDAYPVLSTKDAGADPGERASRPEPPRRPAVSAVPQLRTVYFDYDSAELTSETRQALADAVEWLKRHSKARVQIEGHCDQRGTHEYNLMLGQKRADAVRAFLIEQGADPKRMHTISYGKERPVASGDNETAWRLNRRVRFVVYNE